MILHFTKLWRIYLHRNIVYYLTQPRFRIEFFCCSIVTFNFSAPLLLTVAWIVFAMMVWFNVVSFAKLEMDVSTSKTAKARLLRPTDANLKGFTATMGKSLWLKGRIHKPCGQQKMVKVGKMRKIGEKWLK